MTEEPTPLMRHSLYERELIARELKNEIDYYTRENETLYKEFKRDISKKNVCSLLEQEFQSILKRKKAALDKHKKLLSYILSYNEKDGYTLSILKKERKRVLSHIKTLKNEIHRMEKFYKEC